MFGTLRYDAQNDDTHFIERTTDPLNGKEGQRPRYSACDKCRAKKVCGCMPLSLTNDSLIILRPCSKDVVVDETAASDAYVLPVNVSTPSKAKAEDVESVMLPREKTSAYRSRP